MANTKDIVASGKSSGVIHCLTIPLHEETALLPNAAIAEVIAYKRATPIDDAPEWLLGFFEWREKKVPLISFEAVSGKNIEEAKKNSRIAVLNTLNGSVQLPYIGILSQGIPSLAIVQEEGLKDKSDAGEKRASVSAFVELGGIDVVIPNLDDIERRLKQLNFA